MGCKTLVAMLCLATSALCSAQPHAWRVGVLYWSADIAGQVAMRQGLEQQVQRINQQAQTQGLPGMELLV